MSATFLNDCVIDLQIYISEENYLFFFKLKEKKTGVCEIYDFIYRYVSIYTCIYIHSWKGNITSNLI